MPIFGMFGYHSWNISYCIGNNTFLQFAATTTKKINFFVNNVTQFTTTITIAMDVQVERI